MSYGPQLIVLPFEVANYLSLKEERKDICIYLWEWERRWTETKKSARVSVRRIDGRAGWVEGEGLGVKGREWERRWEITEEFRVLFIYFIYLFLIYTKPIAAFKQTQLQTCFKLDLYKMRLRYTVVAAFIENAALGKA